MNTNVNLKPILIYLRIYKYIDIKYNNILLNIKHSKIIYIYNFYIFYQILIKL